MSRRVIRSKKRTYKTYRRRGSQLLQRNKRSKLLKRTLKRRNSFRKKNTYKRRKTNMKIGGRLNDEDPPDLSDPYTFVNFFNNGYYMKKPISELSKDLAALLNDKKKPQNINILQKEVWSYAADLETHTVETHIYRLRKKISDKFKDNYFILSSKEGYSI